MKATSIGTGWILIVEYLNFKTIIPPCLVIEFPASHDKRF